MKADAELHVEKGRAKDERECAESQEKNSREHDCYWFGTEIKQ